MRNLRLKVFKTSVINKILDITDFDLCQAIIEGTYVIILKSDNSFASFIDTAVFPVKRQASPAVSEIRS
jgi:hypothetical protein